MINNISVSNDSTRMLLDLSNGQSVTLTAEFLRANAMDASSRRERIEHGAVSVSADIQISELRQVGHTGLNVCFSDGNDRAIFPYRYLQSLVKASIDN